jgi:hypothetical protein
MTKQRAFATLTHDEINQIADWLRTHTYDQVIDLVAKPRPEGFGLKISRKPLQLLHAKLHRLDKINAHITTGEKLTLSNLDAINAGEQTDLAEETHDAILAAAHDLATTGDNTPAQLLALQRLADFPARAEQREHKIQMDLARLEIARERLAIQKRKLELTEKLTAKKLNAKPAADSTPTAPQRKEDHLGPLARNWEEIGERVCKQFNISPEEAARRAELHKTWVQPHVNPKHPVEINPIYD